MANAALLQEVRRSLQERAAKVTTIGWAGSKSLSTSRRKPREGVMTFQISQRGKEYLKTAQTLLRTAKTMTDQAIAAQLKALADDYERRAEKASLDDAAEGIGSIRQALNTSGIHELMGSFPRQLSGRARNRTSAESRSERQEGTRAVSSVRKLMVYPARILRKKGLFRSRDWD